MTKIRAGSWRLSIPPGPSGSYRLAQLDDYTKESRAAFNWTPPVTMSVNARVCPASAPGTWGFGLWNDPFSLSLGVRGTTRRLPALPNTAWFFYASAPNYLSLRDDLPALGFLTATFQSPRLPAPLLALTLPALPLALLPPTARLLRRLGTKLVRQDAAEQSSLLDPARQPSPADGPKHTARPADASPWHHYSLEWQKSRATFLVDDEPVLETPVSPRGPLGLVLWIDNQYAAWHPQGRLTSGTLPNPEPAWMEIADLEMD